MLEFSGYSLSKLSGFCSWSLHGGAGPIVILGKGASHNKGARIARKIIAGLADGLACKDKLKTGKIQ
jgi:hypothetical protein